MSNVRFILEKYFLRLLMLRNPINRPKEVNDRATYRRGRNVKMRISFTSVRRDGIIRAVAICKSVLPDNIIYIYVSICIHIYVYTRIWAYYTLQSEVRVVVVVVVVVYAYVVRTRREKLFIFDTNHADIYS